jgi:NAD(P)-dependent dehydrogenase (short-subunit alcohol dehydrogenase family)
MAEARTVVVTGASRGLGLATATHLYHCGWTVLAAMRTPDDGLERLRAQTHAPADDARLTGVQLDLDDLGSIATAAQSILDAAGPPDAIVHNAGVAAVGSLEELPDDVWQQVLSTNFLGPVRLTRELLPSMRGAGRGRIVVVSSQGAIHGMPGVGAYSAAKGALERWAESLSQEIAPFGLGVTVLIAGAFKTDMLELTQSYADPDGPYGPLHANLELNGRRFLRFAGSPEKFAAAVANAVEERRPFARHAVGFDAQLLLVGSRLMPARLLQRVTGAALGLPRPGSLRSRANSRAS